MLGGSGGGAGGAQADGGRQGAGGGQQPSIQQLHGAEQVAAIFERAAVVSFDMVLALAAASDPAPPAAAASLLALIKKHAVLVRGNWVRKSALCGLPPRLAAARDALLLLLLRYGGLSRPQFAQAAGLADEEVVALLRPLATLDKDRRMWVPSFPDDAAFCRAHPEAAAQQAKAWRERERDREVVAILQAVGTPDCPFPGPVEGGGEAATAAVAMDVGGAGKGGGNAAGGKARRK